MSTEPNECIDFAGFESIVPNEVYGLDAELYSPTSGILYLRLIFILYY